MTPNGRTSVHEGPGGRSGFNVRMALLTGRARTAQITRRLRWTLGRNDGEGMKHGHDLDPRPLSPLLGFHSSISEAEHHSE